MAFDPSRVNILLVEDTAVMRKIEKKTLKALGFANIRETVDGEAAVHILQEGRPVDLVISDWNMPNKDGYELLCWIRASEKHQTLPFLMATGQGDKAQEKKAVDAGVDAFVAKPFNEEELKVKIEEALGLAAAADEQAPEAIGPRETVSGRVKLKVAHKPEMAAEIGVKFLDADKTLGLKVPVLKNVLSEELGIKTADLYPTVADLKTMNDYMVKRMRIGAAIDMEAFVDTRFADAAIGDRVASNPPSCLHIADQRAEDLLLRGAEETLEDKSMLNLEGKYLTFELAGLQFGIDILTIREIVGMQTIHSVPLAPECILGVINLRGKVIPVMDLRARFGMGAMPSDGRNCIVVLESMAGDAPVRMVIAVDAVSEVVTIRASDIESTPHFGLRNDTRHVLAMAKTGKSVKQLLDIDHILHADERLGRWVPPAPDAEAA